MTSIQKTRDELQKELGHSPLNEKVAELVVGKFNHIKTQLVADFDYTSVDNLSREWVVKVGTDHVIAHAYSDGVWRQLPGQNVIEPTHVLLTEA